MELITILNKENVVEIKGYEELKATVDRAIKKSKRTETIANNFELTDVKTNRTKLRKAKEAIATLRKETYRQYLGHFEDCCKELEKSLDDVDKELKELVDSYTKKEVKPSYVITIKVKDAKLCKEIVKIVNEKGLIAEVKEK